MKATPENLELYKETKEVYVCLLAETEFFRIGKHYNVWTKEDDPEGKYVRGSDGLFDRIGMTVSRFRPLNKPAKKKKEAK